MYSEIVQMEARQFGAVLDTIIPISTIQNYIYYYLRNFCKFCAFLKGPKYCTVLVI